MDEDARRSHGKPALWNAFAVREGCYQKYPEGSAAISIRVRTDAAAGSRWHHHAKRTVLRTSSWRGAHDWSGAASAGAARPGREAADVHHGAPPAVPFGIAHP